MAADCRAARLLREVVDCEPESLPPYNVRRCGRGRSCQRRESGGKKAAVAAPKPGARFSIQFDLFFFPLQKQQDEEVRLVIEECHEHYALMREIFG